MPPKRKYTDASTSTASSKRSKSTKNDSSDDEDIPRSDRWAPVSASTNADSVYRPLMLDPAKAFSYNCLCDSQFAASNEMDKDSGDEDEASDGDVRKDSQCGLEPDADLK